MSEEEVKKVMLGREFRSQRVLMGLTQGEVARVIGVHQTWVSAYERGYKQNETMRAKLEKYYNLAMVMSAARRNHV